MNIINTEIPEVKILKPKIFADSRGYFFEPFNKKLFEEKVCKTIFVQDNESKSSFGVLRGLHYQLPPFAQSKLVRVVKGKVLDVAVDIRKGSPTFLKYVGIELSDENKKILFIPRGFAHGFIVLSEDAIFQYKCDNFYSPDHEGSIIWNDPKIAINWGLDNEQITLSGKDKNVTSLDKAILFNYSQNLYA